MLFLGFKLIPLFIRYIALSKSFSILKTDPRFIYNSGLFGLISIAFWKDILDWDNFLSSFWILPRLL